MKVPAQIAYWTPDAVAECLDVTHETYTELWGVLNNPLFKSRPQGGDGTDGSIETPDDFSGNMIDAWPHLSETAKANIIAIA